MDPYHVFLSAEATITPFLTKKGELPKEVSLEQVVWIEEEIPIPASVRLPKSSPNGSLQVLLNGPMINSVVLAMGSKVRLVIQFYCNADGFLFHGRIKSCRLI